MRGSLWIAASVAAIMCCGGPVGAQGPKQDEKPGAAAGGGASEQRGAERVNSKGENRSERGRSAEGSARGEGGEQGKSARGDDDKQGASNREAGGDKGREGSKQRADSGERKSNDRDKADKADTGKKAADETKAKKPNDNNRAETQKGEPSKAGQTKTKAAERAGDRKAGQKDGSASTAAYGSSGAERQDNGSAAQGPRQRSEGRVQISEQQRTTIHERVLKSGNVNRVTKVEFTVNVGARVPRTLHLVALPAFVIEIVPAYRSYEYFVVDDRICVVEPASYEIVEIIDTSGPRAAAFHSGSLQLSANERLIILRTIDVRSDGRDLTIPREGAEVPSRVKVNIFPQTVVRDVPKLERFRYFVAEGSVVIVDPRDDRVALVIGAS